uniref:Uncharacterized protein n=1 Tax=Paramormyrops kingsleyae TaxID=1676925 RepID=A0A3B3R579_9TELE
SFPLQQSLLVIFFFRTISSFFCQNERNETVCMRIFFIARFLLMPCSGARAIRCIRCVVFILYNVLFMTCCHILSAIVT